MPNPVGNRIGPLRQVAKRYYASAVEPAIDELECGHEVEVTKLRPGLAYRHCPKCVEPGKDRRPQNRAERLGIVRRPA